MTNNVTIGIDLGGTKLLLVAGNQHLRVNTGLLYTPQQIENQIRKFVHKMGETPSGIGIAIPGLVDNNSCIKACDVLPKIVGWCPAEALADIDCPIVVINDVSAALIEEFHDAEPRLTGGVVMVGTGIGAAFQIEGLPLRGSKGWAGELGYLPIAMNGQVKRLDELAGGAFIAEKLGNDGKNLAALVAAGDEMALRTVRQGGYALGLGLAAVINLFNPAKLALGGGTLSLLGYQDAAYEAAKSFSLPDLWDSCELSMVKSGDAVVALGAARLVKSQKIRLGNE
jgi:predicted NBD/HSP70 family sugar kinase